mmetsp:Transcript_23796/g.20709  ORF Transcript_23796/g.20709 Transcript_23796/m.20709 type:complete len:215 (+) Transcript_23796:396-1040(+)
MVPCDPSYFSAVEGDFDTFPLEVFFCIDPEQLRNNEVSLKGFYQSGNFHDVRFMLLKCDPNNDQGIECESEEDFNLKMEGAYIDMIFVHKFFEPTDYKNPVKNFGLQAYTFSSKVLSKQVVVKLQNNYIETDSGLVGSEIEVTKFQTIKELKEQISGPSNSFFEMVLNFDEERVTYRRTYVKVQEILAELDGFITFVILLLVMIFVPIVRVKYF